ncbi:DUF481 domain-containing protein [Novosphingobium sp. ERN07]|uniref:DUF481 domain-containing protein n=1 Tax=Novosphingobium sp. ERN07 TaxID=2726187 RepID=UPI00145740E9|nr:DUF481 domain-containing protein [Novosphingobium sp. ERN07]NLR70199.1 DUF481 domain-containing protein [Novosphingobium sp. ERN07]
MATAPAVAQAAEIGARHHVGLSPAIAAIIDAALASGDRAEIDTVIRTAKRALPQSADAIDRYVASRVDAPISIAPPAPTPPPVLAANRKTPGNKAPSAANQPPSADGAPVKWSGEGEAGAFVNTGNAPGIGLVGGFKMLVEGENWRIGTNARADYQETNSVVTREQYRFSAEPNYKFDERGYLFGLGQYEQDRFQGFASRYSVSGGLGYSVLKSDSARLSVKAGPAWRVTEPVAAARESVVAGLASMEAKVKITPSLEYSQDASIYSDATGSTFYTLAALDSKLIGKLKARFSYMVQHETAPELGRLGTDTTSRLSLVYGF